MLASTQLGTQHGLPVTVVVTVNLTDLHEGRGHVLTAGGSRIPMSDLIRIARHSWQYLAVFDDHTQRPLYLGRTRRLATGDQWLVLTAAQRGCTRPDCTRGALCCEVHHDDEWAQRGGNTDVTDESLACPPDHVLLSKGWRVRKRPDGRAEWIPPPHFGGPEVNDHFFPEDLLMRAAEEITKPNTPDTG